MSKLTHDSETTASQPNKISPRNSEQKKQPRKESLSTSPGPQYTTPENTEPSFETLRICGARENNLQNFDLSIPHNSIVAITGLSGSGKSTLAFDTIYAEGGRRYIETFSPYTRQFLDKLSQPDLDTITGVRPALALEQRNRISNSRSTVGTVTEINEYLRTAWLHLCEIICPTCSNLVQADQPKAVRDQLLQEAENQSAYAIAIGFRFTPSPHLSYAAVRDTFVQQGFIRCIPHNEPVLKRFEDADAFPKHLDSDLTVVCDRLVVDDFKADEAALNDRFLSTVRQAYACGHGALEAWLLDRTQTVIPNSLLRYTEFPSCSKCGSTFPEPKSELFTFNSPIGACTTCNGFGRTLEIDFEKVVPDHTKSMSDGAIACWNGQASRSEMRSLKKFCEEQEIPLTIPWGKLSEQNRSMVLNGGKKGTKYRGVIRWFEGLQDYRHRMHLRMFLARFRSEALCSTCHGTRLKATANLFTIEGKTLPDVWRLPISNALKFFEDLLTQHPRAHYAETALEEIISRLNYLSDVGLPYLTLDRQSRTLSGGESQRVNLTSIIGSRLTKTMLVLDEPTIGLHQRDTNRLIDVLRLLRERGNSVIVVEHDQSVIAAADEVIEIGPESGSKGGRVVFQGSPAELAKADTHTGRALTQPQSWKRARHTSAALKSGPQLSLRGASSQNLKNVDVDIPLQSLVVVSGVSGSGKSTLVHQCLFSGYQRATRGMAVDQVGAGLQELRGLEHLDEIILIDQEPVGRTPRSNPATYTKAWDLIRECLAETEQAQRVGLSKSSFSFNVDGGRCPVCAGAGKVRIEMQFLADIFVECEQCNGARFQRKVLEVALGGKNVLEILQMTLSETIEFLKNLGEDKKSLRAAELLSPLIDLGLGYLRLGHPLSDVSGGEAQRIKLASYLQQKEQRRCLFILDEPTTGLHPHNIQMLLGCFERLLGLGHSILCIEHNLDVIAAADWIIDLGPEGGEGGGQVLVAGAPQELAKSVSAAKASSTVRFLRDHQQQLATVDTTAAAPARYLPPKSKSTIEIQGARHHNLKDISVSIPQNLLTVVTGVSGSGKSSLAFDILFAEGQRRYIDCLSPYARQFMKQLERADVDLVDNIPPTIAISQKTAPPFGVSTVATLTEVYQFLRLLYSKVGAQHCPHDDNRITTLSSESIADVLCERYASSRVFLFAPVVSGRKGIYNDLFVRALKAEIEEARIDGKMVKLTQELRLERQKLHSISLLVGSVSAPTKNREMLHHALEQCFVLGGGTIEVVRDKKDGVPEVFSTARVCPHCKRGFLELDPQDFSFRSKRGVCTTCQGRGMVDKKGKNAGRVECPTCNGARIAEIGRHVFLDGISISQLSKMTAPHLLTALEGLDLPERLAPVVAPIMRELTSRLRLISEVGLDYLSLDRDASTMSGGEAQRLRIARTLGSPLTGVCYILDEPTIGLHPQDQKPLLGTLQKLRDAGNSVIVVEHDEDVIRGADFVVDIGPHGGREGGNLVVAGTPAEVEATESSVTGAALRARTAHAESFELAEQRASYRSGIAGANKAFEIVGATTNNLKDVAAKFLVGQLTVVAGVSGSGKSSLVHGTLIPAIFSEFGDDSHLEGPPSWKALRGFENFERMVEIDQAPIGKTSTSTPASYLGIFDDIRKVFALIPDAKARGLTAAHFSFNTGKGRCENCSGRGEVSIPMSFLPDATTRCEVCHGLRYNETVNDIRFQGYSLGEILMRTVADARAMFENHPPIRRSLDYMCELGLGYLILGQPTYTLSGGEAQRLKIAKELGLREAKNTLYVLDEPTIGLHMVDVDKLVKVLRTLIAKENTVIVIEHNLDVIRQADAIIEMGPGPGERGGYVIYQGSVKGLFDDKVNTPTSESLKEELERRSPKLVQSSTKRRKEQVLSAIPQAKSLAKVKTTQVRANGKEAGL